MAYNQFEAMLKMMTKILKPNAGRILVRGRVSSLIELGAGFHPDMSGRENIYINATIFGLKREEIDRRIPEIIRFSELEEFIDNPVRTYSSGMYMRLALTRYLLSEMPGFRKSVSSVCAK